MFLRSISFAALLALLPATAQAQGREDFDAATSTALEVGQSYLEAYIARDWDRLEPLMADEVTFQDTTAKRVFGGVPRAGKTELMDYFRSSYGSISSMEFAPLRSFASSDTAVFEGTLDWSVDMGGGRMVSSTMPMVVVLTLQDGKVVTHRDYADYRPFLEANEASMAG